jgi:hypothetical protein
LEVLQDINDPKETIPLMVKCIKDSLGTLDLPKHEFFAENADYDNYSGVLSSELKKYCSILDKPLIIFFDEADCLSNGALISFMRQLRSGYINRTFTPFVHSIALVGMRNIRDYKTKIRPDSETLGSTSPFNIITEALTLQNFTKDEIISLYQQHTDETGQIFENEAIDFIFEQTQGQPWLVNAIAREVIVKILDSDYSQTITADMAKTAIETIIFRRDTHIDNLMERLKEERVRSIIEPMISGEGLFDRMSDDYQYVIDLGLIKEIDGRIQPANPIYSEVIVRKLSYDVQQNLILLNPDAIIPRYLKAGKMDINFLLEDFQQFWRDNSDIWIGNMHYKEAAPHLILQGFLQRVVNGGGHVIRDMAAGTGRLDLGVVYEGNTYPIEIKLWKGEQYYQSGLEQAAQYIDVFGGKEGWLVICDQRKGKTWEERIFFKQEIVNDTIINVFGI